MSEYKRLKAQERLRRIEVLGGFGRKPTQIKKDKSKYNRKNKYGKLYTI